jgi:hypothetical protein
MESTPEDAGNLINTFVTSARRSSDEPPGTAEAKTHVARILVVEDQDDVRCMLVTALQIDGHDVADASNATDGLRRLQ